MSENIAGSALGILLKCSDLIMVGWDFMIPPHGELYRLSEHSIQQGSQPVKFPEVTNSRWMINDPTYR